MICRFSAILYTLAKQAKELNYKKLNLQVNNRIQKLRVPSALQEQVDVSVKENYESFHVVLIHPLFLLDIFYENYTFLS